MTYKEMRQLSGMTQQKFADFFGIPKRTIEDWDAGKSTCKPYLVELLAYRIINPHDDFERCHFNMKDLRLATGMTQSEFAKYFGVLLGTLKHWEGVKPCADYVLTLIEYKLFYEKIII